MLIISSLWIIYLIIVSMITDMVYLKPIVGSVFVLLVFYIFYLFISKNQELKNFYVSESKEMRKPILILNVFVLISSGLFVFYDNQQAFNATIIMASFINASSFIRISK